MLNLKSYWWAGVVLVFFLALVGDARAQGGSTSNSAANADPGGYASVRVQGRTLFQVMGSGSTSASERAAKINRRLENLIAESQPIRPFTQADLATHGNVTTINLGGDPIVTVTDADAQDALSTREELALLWGGKMATAVADARATRQNPLQGAGILIRNSFSDLIAAALQWLPRLAGAVVLLILFWLLARANRWIARVVFERAHFDMNLRQLVRALAFYGTWSIGAVAILSTLGLDSSGIATTLGIGGFVLGFAFKDILSHFFAGIMLLIGRQFHIGDQIVVKEFEGTVERIELRALFLRTYDNRLVLIPNGDVFTSVVTSNTASPCRRREFVVGISYEDDIGRAQRVALDAVHRVEGVMADPEPDVLVDGLSASTVDLRVRFFTPSHRADYLKVGSECIRSVKEAFDRERISMPSQMQTVVIQNLKDLDPVLHAAHASAPSSEHRADGRVSTI